MTPLNYFMIAQVHQNVALIIQVIKL